MLKLPHQRPMISTTKASSSYLQRLFNNPGGAPPDEGEGCLYLNIFAPVNASSSNWKAVLFWIYGGNLVFGSGSLLYYNGSSFAGFQDVIVVTFNYRQATNGLMESIR